MASPCQNSKADAALKNALHQLDLARIELSIYRNEFSEIVMQSRSMFQSEETDRPSKLVMEENGSNESSTLVIFMKQILAQAERRISVMTRISEDRVREKIEKVEKLRRLQQDQHEREMSEACPKGA